MPGRNGGTLRRGYADSPGRPKKDHYTRAYERYARTPVPKEIREKLKPLGFRGKTWADAVSFGQHLAAATGETPAAKELGDRVEGKVKDEVELSGGLDLGVAISDAYDRTRE